MLGDDKSELKQYQILFNNYPRHKLSVRSRYLAGQKLVESRPQLAKKYFENVIHNAPNTDYAIASEYYLGVILVNQYKNAKIIPTSVKDDVQNYFRHYLTKAPSGRHALTAVKHWTEFVDSINKDDYLYLYYQQTQSNVLLQ